MRKHLFTVSYLAFCPILLAQQPIATANSTAAPEPPSAVNSRPLQPHTLLDGTPVKLRLSQTISSADAKVGQEIPFEVVEEVKVDDVVVLPKGATAIGTVTDCNAKKSMGRAGKLNMSISYARLADQEKVALRATQDNKGGGHVGAMTGAMVATSIVFFPAAPLFLFIHGKDITIPQGTEITSFVEGDMHLNMANFGVAPAPISPAQPVQAQASIVVESAPTGADIEVDGLFVGNTPSTINVTPGTHEIIVKKKGFADWSRKLNVTGGSIHLSADLDSAATPPAPVSAAPVAPTPATPVAPAPAVQSAPATSPAS
jgi:PEGA domain-containing protein